MLFKVGDIVQVRDDDPLYPGAVGPVTRVEGEEDNQAVTVLLKQPFGYDGVQFHSSELILVQPNGMAAVASTLFSSQPEASQPAVSFVSAEEHENAAPNTQPPQEVAAAAVNPSEQPVAKSKKPASRRKTDGAKKDKKPTPRKRKK